MARRGDVAGIALDGTLTSTPRILDDATGVIQSAYNLRSDVDFIRNAIADHASPQTADVLAILLTTSKP